MKLRAFDLRVVCMGIIICVVFQVFALDEATVLYYVYEDGLYLSHYPENNVEKLVDGDVLWDKFGFSPDGKQIAYADHGGDNLYTINNDGTDNKRIFSKENAWHDEAHPHWTTNGFMWFSNDTWQQYIPEEDAYNILPGKMSDIAQETCTGSNYKEMDVWASRDGYRWWFHDGADPKGIDSIYCGVRGYNRGGRAYFHWNNDFTSYDVIWRTEWGHGDGMTSDGHLMLAELGGHRNIGITYQTRDQLEKLDYNHQGADDAYYDYVPPTPDEMENRNIAHCVNNPDLVGSRGFKSKSGAWHSYIWNWRDNTFIAEVKDPAPNENHTYHSVMVGVWAGALPDPHDAQPYINIGKSELTFVYDGQNQPDAQEVKVNNQGDGQLSTVSASCDANWLEVSVNNDGSGTQIVTNTILVENLSGDESQTTVKISGGGAPNEASYTVLAYQGGAIPVPSEVTVEAAGDSMLDAKVQWKDNASSEDGYIIERQKGGESWSEVGRTNADEVSYTDEHLAYYTTYSYRVKAYQTLGDTEMYSSYSSSSEVTIEGIPWIRVINPEEGDTISSGSTLNIIWSANKINQVVVSFSSNNGLTWDPLSDSGGIEEGSPAWPEGGSGTLSWEVDNNMETDNALCRVKAYFGDMKTRSGKFYIHKNLAVEKPAQRYESAINDWVHIRANRKVELFAPADEDIYSLVHNSNGQIVADAHVRAGNSRVVSLSSEPAGIYFIELRRGSKNGEVFFQNRYIIMKK